MTLDPLLVLIFEFLDGADATGEGLGIFCIGGVVAPLVLIFAELGNFCICAVIAPSFAKTIFLDIHTSQAKFIPEKTHVSTTPITKDIAATQFNDTVILSSINLLSNWDSSFSR